MIHEYFRDRLWHITNLCIKYNILRLQFFGSSVTDNFVIGTSDLDIVISIDRSKVCNILSFKKDLEELCNCKVDLFNDKFISNRELRQNIDSNSFIVYSNYC